MNPLAPRGVELPPRLPEVVELVAELMREVLLRGCVVPERARLVFPALRKTSRFQLKFPRACPIVGR